MRDAVARQLEESPLVVNREWPVFFFKGGGDKMGKPLGLRTQHQVQTNRCWAAVATSVSQFLDKPGSSTQRILASQQLNQGNWVWLVTAPLGGKALQKFPEVRDKGGISAPSQKQNP